MGRRIPLLATSIGCTRIGSTTASTIRRGRRTTLPSRQESDRVVFEFTSLTGELNKLSDPIFAASWSWTSCPPRITIFSEILQSYLPIILLKTHHTVRSVIGTFMISLRPQHHQQRQLCRNSNKGCLQIVSLNPSSSRAILNQWTRKAQLGKLNRYLWQTTERQSKCRSPKAPQAKIFEVSTHSRGDFGWF